VSETTFPEGRRLTEEELNSAEKLRFHRDYIEGQVADAEARKIVVRRAYRSFRIDIVAVMRSCQFCDTAFLLTTPEVNASSVRTCSTECERFVSNRKKREEAQAIWQEQNAARLQAERRRLLNCPRPDKIAWHTAEVADQVRWFMRQQHPDTTDTLVTYLCKCGYHHVGRYAAQDDE
jgi:hypothetical protein